MKLLTGIFQEMFWTDILFYSTTYLSQVSQNLMFYNRGRHVQISENKVLDIQCLFCTKDPRVFLWAYFAMIFSIEHVKVRSQASFIKSLKIVQSVV